MHMAEENNQEEYILFWEAPKPQVIEYRLYYDNKGNVICYSTEKLPGNFIVIDKDVFIEARPDLRVINGQLSRVDPSRVVNKLTPSDEGVSCSIDDINIIVYDSSVPTQKWEVKVYELR